jgi:signal transduction histidine kinase
MMERKLNVYKGVSIYNNNNPIFVEADKDRIIQVLSNLLSNATSLQIKGKYLLIYLKRMMITMRRMVVGEKKSL